MGSLQQIDVSKLRRNLTGQKFNKLTVIGLVEEENKRADRCYLWDCLCDCGNKTRVRTNNITGGRQKSCGCLFEDTVVTHGHDRTRRSPELNAYWGAKMRCTVPNTKRYEDYGGRGIKFLFDSFEEFLAVVGLCPGAGYSLDRIDNNGNYEKGNLRWATKREQKLNQRTKRIENFSDNELLTELERRGLSVAGSD